MKTKISLIAIALCIVGFVGGQSFTVTTPEIQNWSTTHIDTGYRTDVERIVNTGANLFIYYREHGTSLTTMCLVAHPHGTACDYTKVDRRWRHVYGISNNLIVDMGRQEPTAVVTKTTNVTETVTEWIYRSNVSTN